MNFWTEIPAGKDPSPLTEKMQNVANSLVLWGRSTAATATTVARSTANTAASTGASAGSKAAELWKVSASKVLDMKKKQQKAMMLRNSGSDTDSGSDGEQIDPNFIAKAAFQPLPVVEKPAETVAEVEN